MTNRQFLINELKKINRADAAALLPTDKLMLNRLDEPFESKEHLSDFLFCFNWVISINANFWLKVFKQLGGYYDN